MRIRYFKNQAQVDNGHNGQNICLKTFSVKINQKNKEIITNLFFVKRKTGDSGANQRAQIKPDNGTIGANKAI